MATNTKQPKNLPILITAAALVLVLALILGLCLGGNGPVDKLERAAKKTLFAKSFTTLFSIEINGKPFDGNINASVDPEERKLEVYMQLTTFTSEYICGIYDGTFAVCTADNKLRTTDVSDRVDAFFDALEKDSAPDWALLLDIDDTDLYAGISESFDFDVLLTCLGNWLNNLNHTEWAETYAGYGKDRVDGVTVFSFNPDPYVLLQQSLPLFEEAFRQKQDISDLKAYMEDAKFLFKDGKTDFSFGIKGGKLVSAEFALQYFNTDISGKLSFIGIGSTIVDTETIAYYIEEANN